MMVMVFSVQAQPVTVRDPVLCAGTACDGGVVLCAGTACDGGGGLCAGKAIKEEREEQPAMVPVPEEEKRDDNQVTSDGREVARGSQTEGDAIMVKQEIKTEPEDAADDKDPADEDKMQTTRDDEEDDEEDDAIPVEPEDSWNVQVEFEVELACLEDVEALEDRIFNASLQVKVSECALHVCVCVAMCLNAYVFVCLRV